MSDNNAHAEITWISGPVLRARSKIAFRTHEAVSVGAHDLLGEVIRINGDEIVAQVYEDTTGLQPGDSVRGHGRPLSVRLGPGLLGKIFDGLLRPLSVDGTRHVQQGMRAMAAQTFRFGPQVEVGETLPSGTVFGNLQSASGSVQRALIPPYAQGKVIQIAGIGDYPDDQTLCVLEDTDGRRHDVAMSHVWPVRTPRPVIARLGVQNPLLTGQRILDTLFPVACGSRATLPGGFGTGKTVLQETLAKWCDADIIIYVGCGERGNEMTCVLHEFPQLEDPRTGRPLMERTVIIANTSNMPVAAREASIYTGVTVAEYFRDQGMRVALMADSTSRWAEALREVSGRLGELPSEGGYPAYLSSRLASFYERAARTRTRSGRGGSVTIIGAVSPPSADFSEPVTTHTKRYVRNFWALDTTRAQARFFPAVNPLLSYSEDAIALAPWWKEQGSPQWLNERRRLLTLLEQQAHLERMARIVGKDALPPRQQYILLCAELINEAFLRQSAFSMVDRYCSPARQIAMLRALTRFFDLAEQAIDRGVSPEQLGALPVLRRLRRMGEEISEDDLEQFDALMAQLETECAGLSGAVTNDAR